MKAIIKQWLYFFYSFWIIRILNKKISAISKKTQHDFYSSKEKTEEHKNIWKPFGKKVSLKWYKVFASINNIEDPRYISEIDYYINVEPRLNNRTFSEAYSDKNHYHNYIDNAVLPIVYLRNIQGAFYSDVYETINRRFDLQEFIPLDRNKIVVKKAIDTGGGFGVELFNKQNGEWINSDKKVMTVDYLINKFGKNFIIQEYVQQHNYYSRFNQSSLNTIRLFTYRSVLTNEVIPLQSVLRIGRIGSFVDNQASGGIVCGINNGILNSFAINKYGEKFDTYNGIVFKEVGQLFKYDEIVRIGLEVAKKYYYHRLLGFDFCVDNNGSVKLIEINNKNNEINFYQMNNGPLFREYTKEIIDYCSVTKKNICFDFEI